MTASACFAAIVLLMDVSASVSERLYRHQRDGTAAAFEDASIARRIADAEGIAVLVAHFAFRTTTRLDWTIIRSHEDAFLFARSLRGLERVALGDDTAVGSAIEHARLAMGEAPCRTSRRIIDISTDGHESVVRSPAARARDAALADGVSINAVVFASDLVTPEAAESTIADGERWITDNVVTGFVVTAGTPDSFRGAFLSKLAREIALSMP